MKHSFVFLADGFEEIEAVTPEKQMSVSYYSYFLFLIYATNV